MDKEKSVLFSCKIVKGGSPLDFSFNALSKKWTTDIPAKDRGSSFRPEYLMEYIRDSKLFSPFFTKVSETIRKPKNGKASKSVAPQKGTTEAAEEEEMKQDFILVETEPFFRDYTLTIVNSPRPEKSTLRNDNTKLPPNFGVNFFKNARNSIKNDPDTLAYYDKKLYSHPTFQSYASKYYWEAEFDRRCRLLKKMILKCAPDQRLYGLPDILAFLDAKIGVYAYMAEDYQKMPESERTSASSKRASLNFVAAMPINLLSLRKTGHIEADNSGRPLFCFHDIPVAISPEEELPLSAIFTLLMAHSSPQEKHDEKERRDQLQAAARKAYLLSLSQEVKGCNFLDQAHTLDEYLQSSSTQKDLAQIIPEIKEIARQYYSHLLNHTDYQSFTLQNIPENAASSFLFGIISSFAHMYLNNQTDLHILQEIPDDPTPLQPNPETMPPENYHKVESPELFFLFFKKFVGWDFTDCINIDPQYTCLEQLMHLYRTHLYWLEYPASDGPNKENSCKEPDVFLDRHMPSETLDWFLHAEWKARVTIERDSLKKYLNGATPDFPWSDSILHRVLIVVKLYANCHQTIDITTRCYAQYKAEEEKASMENEKKQ